MNRDFWDTPVAELMNDTVVTVSDRDTMESAAEKMKEHSIGALPVIHDSGLCVGVLTNQNIAEYEAIRKEVENDYAHGHFFDLARYGIEPESRIAKIRFDEVDHHMNRHFVSVRPDDTVRDLAKKMCANHSHYGLVMSEESKIEGIVSALDFLSSGIQIAISR